MPKKWTIAGTTSHMEKCLADFMKKIESKILQRAELALDLARSKAALENGREACRKYIWLLESAGEKHSESTGTADNSEEINPEGATIAGITPEEYIQRHVVEVKQQIDDLRSALSSDLEIYRSMYQKMVKREAARATVEKLTGQRENLIEKLDCYDQHILGDNNGPVGKGWPLR